MSPKILKRDFKGPGIYVIHWKSKYNKTMSVAAVGCNEKGEIWYMPTDWREDLVFNWGPVKCIELITTQLREIAKRQPKPDDEKPKYDFPFFNPNY